VGQAMVRAANRLSAKAVEKTTGPGMHNDGNGLYLRVTDTGARSWLFRFKLGGKERAMGLGAYPDVSLADARELAGDARKLARQGIDPIDARNASATSSKPVGMTFDQCCEAYVEAHKAGWKHAKTPKRWLATCTRYASPVIGKKPVSAVTADHIHEILKGIWTEKHETAITLRGRLEAVLDWATVKGYRDSANPAMWRGNLKHLLPSPKQVRKVKPIKHHAALPWQKVPTFMAELRNREGFAARALEITLLCATRTMEAVAAERSEIHGDVWVVPPERAKTSKPHRIPLSTQAAAIFAGLPVVDGGRYLFPGNKKDQPLSGMSMAMVLQRMGWRYQITVHGFRSTFRDWVAEETTFPREIAEMCLAHTVGSAVERAYRRSDLLEKRRQLMQAWADFCWSERDILPQKSGKKIAV
jgi:integrase